MKARSMRLAVETLEDRCVPSTVAYGDFNHDGLEDMAAITGSKTIVVSLANAAGTYTVSAILTAPKPIEAVTVQNDYNLDGNLDIIGSHSKRTGPIPAICGWATEWDLQLLRSSAMAHQNAGQRRRVVI